MTILLPLDLVVPSVEVELGDDPVPVLDMPPEPDMVMPPEPPDELLVLIIPPNIIGGDTAVVAALAMVPYESRLLEPDGLTTPYMPFSTLR